MLDSTLSEVQAEIGKCIYDGFTEMDISVWAPVGSIVWRFAGSKIQDAGREISARSYALHSVCPNFLPFQAAIGTCIYEGLTEMDI